MQKSAQAGASTSVNAPSHKYTTAVTYKPEAPQGRMLRENEYPEKPPGYKK